MWTEAGRVGPNANLSRNLASRSWSASTVIVKSTDCSASSERPSKAFNAVRFDVASLEEAKNTGTWTPLSDLFAAHPLIDAAGSRISKANHVLSTVPVQ